MADINYLGDIALGKIQNWASKKVGKLLIQPIAMQDAGATEAVDTLGAYEIVDISGRWTGKFTDIQTYIRQIKLILNGNQQGVSQELQSPFVNIRDNTLTNRHGIISTNTAVNTNKLIDTLVNFVSSGIQKDDVVKNLVTGEIAEVYSVANDTLTLVERGTTTPKDIFPVAGASYAVTATMNVKLLNFSVTWNLPGLNFCDYNMSVVQVV